MTKEVMLSIRGLQFELGAGNEEIETIQWGQYFKKNDTHYVVYEELMEGCGVYGEISRIQTGEV